MDENNTLNLELEVLKSILDYKVNVIDSSTRFWMIRTKKGYFYNEFIAQGFVALAWNIIDSSTSITASNIESVKDLILLRYSEIKRPTTVINKCKSFINEIKNGDYIVIPNAGSELITIAIAGDYYEETSKTYELEKEVVSRIETGGVIINDVSCPYKKRREITPLITLKTSNIDGKLYKAISNYHGISNFDDYWRNILGELYNSYCYKGNMNIVYHIKRTDPIGPRQLSQLLLNSIECWRSIFDEEKISVNVNVASPGPVDFFIADTLPQIQQSAWVLAGITIGTVSVLKPELIPAFIKNLFSLPAEISREYISTKREALQKEKEEKLLPLEVEQKQLEILEKQLDILEKLKGAGVAPETITDSATALASTFGYLQIENVKANTEIPEFTYDTMDDEDFSEEEQ